MNHSQGSFTRGVSTVGGREAKPWVAYSRVASRSICAQVLPECPRAVVPVHTPMTGSPVCGSFAWYLPHFSPTGPGKPPFVASSRDGFQAGYFSRVICPENAVGSPASRNASTASRAASWCPPCWWYGRGSMTTTSRGVVARISRTSRESVSVAGSGDGFQTVAVSGAESVYQKSGLSR